MDERRATQDIWQDDAAEKFTNEQRIKNVLAQMPVTGPGFMARQLRLLKGEVFFAKDSAHPFQILTDSAQVQAIGTEFNVYQHGKETRVAVLEGQVSVAALKSGSGPAQLDA